MERDIRALVGQMTLEEKAGMCSGRDAWRMKNVERLGIPQVMMSDGPHGLRKQREAGAGNDDSIEAVCFPTACATACSFDRALMQTLGEALGDECQAEEVSIILGPAVNIKRSPLCGRNFEYISEDPYLAGQMAAAQIQGVQSRGVGACLKHYAANNQEYHRFTVDAQIDERTLREIYLAAFEAAVRQVQPWTLMCCYNKVNGVYGSENKKLLTDILRGEWGFEGFVMSDWGAVDRRVPALAAGLDLEMPAENGESDAQIVQAVRDGTLPEAVLDAAVERMLRIVFKAVDGRTGGFFDRELHHALAAQIERESAVLLKNDGCLLPLPEGARVAFIGQFAEKPRFQGGGSSHINAYRVTSALEAAGGIPGVTYLPGFPADRDEENPAWADEAVRAAAAAQVAVVFAGLPDSFESEGYDRDHLRLPACQNRLIDRILAVQPNTVVVLHNGSPVEMPWAGRARAILELYLGGQAVGQACVDLLYGRANPCGKLAESFPLRLEDTSAYLNFPGDGDTVRYGEGVFVGYRYYDTRRMTVLFPFGHGLSYTSFAYGNLRVDKPRMRDTEALTVQVDVTNTGGRPSKEIVQLYVRGNTPGLPRPDKELKGFEKLELAPGETKTATFTLDRRSFACYSEALADWVCPGGAYEVLVGASSRDLRLGQAVQIDAAPPLLNRVDQNTRVEDLLAEPRTTAIIQQVVDRATAMRLGTHETSAAREAVTEEMVTRGNREAPLRSMRRYLKMTFSEMDALIEELNAALR